MGYIDNIDLNFECPNCGTESHIRFYQKGSNYAFGDWKIGSKDIYKDHCITYNIDLPAIDTAVCNICKSVLKINSK